MMNYSKLIEERVSSRAFKDKPVPAKATDELLAYYKNGAARLFPGIETELVIAGTKDREKLERAAGYNEFLIGAPQYLILLSEDAPYAAINAGYLMEDLALKLQELSCGACFITFADSSRIKEALSISSGKTVAAILAFGIPTPVRKKIHVNILTMSNVIVKGGKSYFAPKKSVGELTYFDSYGCRDSLEERLDHYGDALREPLHAASLAPSYMNCQPYSFLIKDHKVFLIGEQNDLTPAADYDLNLGVVLLHFTSVLEDYVGKVTWAFDEELTGLPGGTKQIAYCEI